MPRLDPSSAPPRNTTIVRLERAAGAPLITASRQTSADTVSVFIEVEHAVRALPQASRPNDASVG
jgi:hypothetical protein